MARLIHPDGVRVDVELATGLALDNQMRDLFGGWFAVMGVGSELFLVFDPDAFQKKKAWNDDATFLASSVFPGFLIAGDALVVFRSELGS